ncbi:MAG: hypothetical protein LBI84_09625 [Propionibacteriaceae bacterium]|jgi:general stress protein 26|nr:hypothetical protein [Propionibacteriaceae bacterium]
MHTASPRLRPRNLGIPNLANRSWAVSVRVAQYRKTRWPLSIFMDRRFFRGVMLRGCMEVCADAEAKEMIWESGDSPHYALGVTAPDCRVLRFAARGGRYHSNSASTDFDIADPAPLDNGSYE